MGKLSIGQVVLASFPFSNLANQKLRPCLVIGIAEFGDIILCQITSQRYSSKRAISLQATDFATGSIAVASYIRPDKIATLDMSMINRSLGTLTEPKLREIKLQLKAVFEIS